MADPVEAAIKNALLAPLITFAQGAAIPLALPNVLPVRSPAPYLQAVNQCILPSMIRLLKSCKFSAKNKLLWLIKNGEQSCASYCF